MKSRLDIKCAQNEAWFSVFFGKKLIGMCLQNYHYIFVKKPSCSCRIFHGEMFLFHFSIDLIHKLYT